MKPMRFSAEYDDGLSNHLPMALLALRRLGASEDRAREFEAFYSRRLRPMSASEEALSDRLAEELARDGKEAWLRERVAQLTPGLATAAFHGIIRTAYAIDTDDLVDAVVSWLRSYSRGADVSSAHKPAHSAGRTDETSAPLFEAIQHDERFERDFSGGNIADRIARVASFEPFGDYAIATPTLEELARIAVKIYLATEDFTALHLVTACHATRVLEPYLAPGALDHLATAMLAAYVTIGRPSFDVAMFDAPDWDTLAKKAIASNDDHDLKLVYSCREEDAVYGWGLHRMAAAVRLGHAVPR